MDSMRDRELLLIEINSYHRMIEYLERQILATQAKLGKHPPHREAQGNQVPHIERKSYDY
jgi:hypothetical protein|tara:strand:- start:6302 stop:6481 length:180 start_codon:yes stop_codon:yes gene_type:complete